MCEFHPNGLGTGCKLLLLLLQQETGMPQCSWGGFGDDNDCRVPSPLLQQEPPHAVSIEGSSIHGSTHRRKPSRLAKVGQS